MTTAQLATEIKEIKAMLQEQSPRPMTLDEAATYLSISKSRLYTLTSTAGICFYKPSGKKIYFQKSDLDAFLLRNRIKPREEIREELVEASH